MRLQSLAAATALTLFLTACANSAGLRPQATLTDPATLHAKRSLAASGVSAAAWPAADWWSGLADPQLDRLIAEALHDNPGLAIADARARAAQATAGRADAARAPSVNGSAAVSGARIPTTVLPDAGHFSLAEYGYVSFKWGLDLWGGKRAAWQAAVGAARAAEVDARAARIALSVNVARAYAQLGYAFARQDLGQAELERASAARELTRQRVAAGIDNQIQLRQGEAEVASAEQNLALAGRAVDAARSTLAVLLGKGPDRGLQIARPQRLQPAAVAVPDTLALGLLSARPDLVAARWRVEAAGKDIESAKTEFLPNISLGAMAGVIGMGGSNPLSLPARFYQLGPSLSLPIFDGGRLRANLAGRDAQYDLAAAQYNQTLVEALNQVTDTLSALRSLDVQVAAQRRAQAAANAAWQLAEQRYRGGIGSYLEALSVRQQLLAAERGTAALEAQQVDVSLQLIQALGGGYRPAAQPGSDDPLAATAPTAQAAPSPTASRP
jgi:NodT family efflux transporter outer membrane factor (OMF) lipoprotein